MTAVASGVVVVTQPSLLRAARGAAGAFVLARWPRLSGDNHVLVLARDA